MLASSESYFDLLVRDFARGGSRRDFVRRSTGLAAAFGLRRAGLPARWGRPVAGWFGLPAACEKNGDCKDPCLICPPHRPGQEVVCVPKCPPSCSHCDNGTCVDHCSAEQCLECAVRMSGEPASCIPQCQASCSECRSGQCVDTCPSCKFCYPGASRPEATCQSIEDVFPCKRCDPATGKESDACSPCEKCEQGQCVSNCPNRCEICENGACRKCGEGPCETCDEQTGKCSGCDSQCERCNGATKECETTCERGLSCCAGKCINCCGSCDGDTCGSFGDVTCAPDARTPACCDGFCYDLDSSERNCGKCGNWCDTSRSDAEICDHGRCVCRGVPDPGAGPVAVRGGGEECPKGDSECCDGRCVKRSSYQSDPKHCGKCIVECEKDERCEKGECVGSKRAGYSVVYVYRVTSEKLGVETSLTMKTVVRRRRTPDAEGNTFAGKGSYEGSLHEHKVNCDNDMPMDSETIPLVGKARGGATVDDLGGGQVSLSFTITPLDPPKRHLLTRSFRALEKLGGEKETDLPDAVVPAVGYLQLKGGRGQDSRTFQMWGGSCSGMLTHVTEWSATRIE